jgi:hypothetical protein
MFALMRILRPSVYVELGVHNGASFFAACQAVVQEGLKTHCVAVDHWGGDPHAGIFDDAVFTAFDKILSSSYSGFASYIRKDFDSAAKDFDDATIDLLHIDGFHTYEAVKKDFETWLPKLSSRGVILFHDVNEYRGSFGVWRFWQEIEATHPGRTRFLGNDHGLGILVTGDDLGDDAQKFFSWVDSSENWIFVQQHLAAISELQKNVISLLSGAEKSVQESVKLRQVLEKESLTLRSIINDLETREQHHLNTITELNTSNNTLNHENGQLRNALTDAETREQHRLNTITELRQLRKSAIRLVTRPAMARVIKAIHVLDTIRGKEAIGPLRILREIKSSGQSEPAPTSLKPSLHLTHEVSSSKSSMALSAMSAEDWKQATELWSKCTPGNGEDSGDKLSPFVNAGTLLSRWLSEPQEFGDLINAAQEARKRNARENGTVIFSANIGGVDPSLPAINLLPSTSCVKFTDARYGDPWGTWTHRAPEFSGATATRSARWIKTHPHFLFPNSKWAIWADANVLLTSEFSIALEQFKQSGKPMGGIPHPLRSSVAEEIDACFKMKKASESEVESHLALLRLPSDDLLWETNVLFFDLEHKDLQALLAAWWKYIEAGSSRDQISLPQATQETGVNIHPILPHGRSTRTDPRFVLFPHGNATFNGALDKLLAQSNHAKQFGSGS